MTSAPSSPIVEFAPNVYIKEYPIHYGGCRFHSRMTIVKLSTTTTTTTTTTTNKGGNNDHQLQKQPLLWIHSPCEITPDVKAEIDALGGIVDTIIAPGNFHHMHVASCQAAFPSAKTYICPGVEVKQKDLKYDGILLMDDDANTRNQTPYKDCGSHSTDDFEQVLLAGNRIIKEVAFFHKPSKTLILVDSIELIGDTTPGTNWLLRLYWKYIMRMWNVAKPAPEYQMGWWAAKRGDKQQAKQAMEQILKWDFESVIISHGENITKNAKDVVRGAWKDILD